MNLPAKDLEELRAENERLKAELDGYRRQTKALHWLLMKGVDGVVGRSLATAVESLKEKHQRGEQLTALDWVDVAVAAFRRLVRVGFIGLLIALVPSLLLFWQCLLIREQNAFLERANKFNIEAFDKTPTVDLSLNSAGCRLRNAGPLPLHSVRLYYGEHLVNFQTEHVPLGGGVDVDSISAGYQRPFGVAARLAPGEEFAAQARSETDLERSCRGYNVFDECKDTPCQAIATCIARFQREGDMRQFEARARAAPVVRDGKCVFEFISEPWLTLSSDPKDQKLLRLLRNLEQFDQKLAPLNRGFDELVKTEVREVP